LHLAPQMSELTDCPSCGGLLPTGKRCCPHCHCKYPVMKRWRLLVALGLGGAASCNNSQMPLPAYGLAPIHFDLSVTVPIDAGHDAGGDASNDGSTE
jgi:hypothetical protein